MESNSASRRLIWIVWSFILAALLAVAILSLAGYFAAARLRFEEVQKLVNSLSADNKVSSFTPVLFDQLLGFALVFGVGLCVIALIWILAFKRSLIWTSDILDEMRSTLAADRLQIRAARKDPGLLSPASLLIPAGFWVIYAWFGLTLHKTPVFHRFNMIFDADVPYVVPALTQWGGQSERHPLLALFFSPFGAALNRLLNSPEAAAAIVNAFAGALAVWLVLLILVRLGLKPFTAALWTGVLGLTTTHVFFASIPESYIFAAGSLALGLYLMLAFPGNLLYSIPAGIYTFGITSINLVHTSIAYWTGLAGVESSRYIRFRRFFLFIFTVLVISVLLNFFQIAVTGFGSIFLLPEIYKDNFEYIESNPGGILASKAVLLAEDFFLFNIAGPNLHITLLELHDDPAQSLVIPVEILDPKNYTRYSFATYIATSREHAGVQTYSAWIIWLGLSVLGLAGIIRKQLYRSPFTIAVVISLLFNFFFHFFWGWDPYLYSPHWTFMLVILVAYGIGNVKHELMLQSILIVLMWLLGWNNAILLSRLSYFFSG